MGAVVVALLAGSVVGFLAITAVRATRTLSKVFPAVKKPLAIMAGVTGAGWIGGVALALTTNAVLLGTAALLVGYMAPIILSNGPRKVARQTFLAQAHAEVNRDIAMPRRQITLA